MILWYRPDLAVPSSTSCFGVAEPYECDVLIVPRDSLATPVGATAWHRCLHCAAVEPDVLSRFVAEFRNDGTEDAPH